MHLEEREKQEIFAHFPIKVSQEIVDYATNVALKDSRYIFIKRSGSRQQYGYCTHCKKQFKTNGLKHNEFARCPNCDSQCRVKSSGRGRTYLRDNAYFVWYEKSLKDPSAITARGIYVSRDYSGEYTNVETKFTVTAMYLFEQGRSRMIDTYWAGSGWRKRKTIISESGTSMQNVRSYCSYESIGNAVKGTPFQYSTWEKYLEGDMLKFFDLAAKYPCIEYLTKLGFSDLVKAKLHGRKTYNVVNWKGKTLNKVLRLTKQEINEIRSLDFSISPFTLYLFQQSKKDGSKFTIGEAVEFRKMHLEFYHDDLKKFQKLTTLRRIYGYIQKQYERKNKNKKHYTSHTQVLITWRDYINDCLKLEWDIKDESILFPTNLYEAHQKTIKKVKIKADETLNLKISKRLKTLDRYRFEYKGLMLRPAVSSIELLEEGTALKHCVGGYADRYARGETNLFVIRNIAELDKPFYTVEIRDDRIVQCRGLRNCNPTNEVQAFIEAFIAEKLTKKKKDRKKVAV